jgi:hypothetical protein
MSDQLVRKCCTDRLSWHDLSGLGSLAEEPKRSFYRIGYNGPAVERWLPVDQTEFNELHTNCVTTLAAYVAEAEKTDGMLAKCTPEPLPLVEGVKVTVQETAENSAHLLYVAAKLLLYDAARLRYAFSG